MEIIFPYALLTINEDLRGTRMHDIHWPYFCQSNRLALDSLRPLALHHLRFHCRQNAKSNQGLVHSLGFKA